LCDRGLIPISWQDEPQLGGPIALQAAWTRGRQGLDCKDGGRSAFEYHDVIQMPMRPQVWDIRMLKELQTLQGHSRDVLSADWHPIHEDVSPHGLLGGV
jgi:hypothetical protein